MSTSTLSPEDFKKQYPELIQGISEELEAAKKQELEFEKRRGRITASEIHKLFTKGLAISEAQVAQTYLREVAAELFGAYKERTYAASLNWGNEWEIPAAEEYMKRYKKRITSYGKNQKFVDWGIRCGGTPDGYIGKKKSVQIKCPFNPAVHLQYLQLKNQDDFKKLFPMYFVQTQSEMLFTSRSECEFISYDHRFDTKYQFATLTLTPDKDFVPILIKRLKEAELEVEKMVFDICESKK